MAITIAGVGVWSFFGFLFMNHHAAGGGGGFSSDDMRTAIASALVLTCVALVAIMLFSEIDPKTVAATSLLSSFTTLLGVVIAFYFGSTAAVDVARAMYGPDPPPAD